METTGTTMGITMSIQHLNPAGLSTNPAFSQGVVVTAERLLIVGGQHGTDVTGKLVAQDLAGQTQ